MRVIKSGIEIISKKNIAEKMQTSVYQVTKKIQNRYENKIMFNFEPKIKVHTFWEGHKILETLHQLFD